MNTKLMPLMILLCFSWVPVRSEKFVALAEMPALDAFDAKIPVSLNQGAYYIFSRMRFDEEAIHIHQLIRITSEAGRSDFHVVLPFDNLILLSGRVLDAEGKTFKFDVENDLMELLAVKTDQMEKKFRLLIPPGMTDDCLVEVIWSVKAEGGLPLEQFSSLYPVNESTFCLERRFEFAREMRKFVDPTWSNDTLELVSRFVWTPYKDETNFNQNVVGNYTTITYKNVPPLRRFPFDSLRGKEEVSWVMVFRTMPYQGLQMRTFWREFARMFPAFFYNFHLTQSSGLSEWLTQIRNTMPQNDTQAALRFVHTRFREAFVPMDMASDKKLEKMGSQRMADMTLDYDTMAIAFGRGLANRSLLGIFLFQIYKELGFKPKVIFAPLEPDQPFRNEYLNAFGLGLNDPLLGFHIENGSWLFLMAGHPEYESGYLLPRFRDRELLVLDPFNGWTHDFLILPRDNPERNSLRRRYKVKCTADGTMNFLLAEKPTGMTEGDLRRILFGLPSESQSQYIADLWNRSFPEGRVFSASAAHVSDFGTPIKVNVKGGTQLPIASSRLHILPFPGDTMPLEKPRAWPSKREGTIEIPENSTWKSEAEVQLPQHWKPIHLPNWKRENGFGSVAISTRPLQEKPGIYLVTREVTVINGLQPAEAEPLLRDFLSWMERAYAEVLTVTQEGSSL